MCLFILSANYNNRKEAEEDVAYLRQTLSFFEDLIFVAHRLNVKFGKKILDWDLDKNRSVGESFSGCPGRVCPAAVWLLAKGQ